MKKKLAGSIIAALCIYVITILIGLIQFKPLSEVFIIGLKISFGGFALSLFILTVIQYFMDNSNNNNNKLDIEEKDEKNKEIDNAAEDNIENKENKNEKVLNSEDKPSDNDFSEMNPPIVEYEE